MKKTNKNYQRLSIFFLMILGMFIVSCKNPLNLKHNSKDAKKAYIRISTNLSDSKVRSALPESFYDSKENDTKPGLIWELSGEESKGSEYEKIWEDDSTTNNTAYKQMLGDTSIELDVGTWTFTLTAYVKNSDDIQEKVLESTIQKTIVSGQNSLLFEMEEAVGDEGVANGEISFTLNFPQNQIDNLAITLYKYPAQEGKYIPLGTQSNQEIEDEVSSYTCEYSNIEPGNYLLEIVLQQETGLNPGGKTPIYTTINTYTCVIHVAPGLKSVGNFNLSSLAKLYQISYKYIDGETEVEAQFDETVTTSYNKYQTFDLPTPTRDGYSFKGWYEAADCTGTKVTSYKIPDDFNETEIVFYAAWEEVVVEPFTLVGKGSNGDANDIAVNTGDNTFKVTIPDGVEPSDVWQYYVEAMPTTNTSGYTFDAGYNYKLSVELKSDELNVIGIAAANTDMFFSVGKDWTTCEFTIGALKSNLTKPVTIGTALSKTTEIRNLKIEQLEKDSSTKLMPSISIMIAQSGIEAYKTDYKDETNPPKIVDFSVMDNGYHFDFNSAGVTLQMRDLDFTGNSSGLNKVSFDITSTNQNLETSLYATTNNPKINTWNGIKTSLDTKETKNLNVLFPIYEGDSNYTLGILSESNTKASIDISNLEVGVVSKDNISTAMNSNGKVFAIKTGDNWVKQNNLPISTTTTLKEKTSTVVFDVLLINEFDSYPGENDGKHWEDCIRFLYSESNCSILENKLSYYKDEDTDGNDRFNIKNDSDSEITCKITLTDDFTVLIEDVTDTNNNQSSGGGTGGEAESNGSSDLKYYAKEGDTAEYLEILTPAGLEKYRNIINGTLTNDITFSTVRTFNANGSPYTISAKLSRDVEVSNWIPIGKESTTVFSFDGQKHSITINNVSSDAGDYAGVFGNIGADEENSIIENLIVKGDISSSTAKYSGGIVAYSRGVTIKNCANYATITNGNTTEGVAGGIIGHVYGTSTINDSVNFAEIQAPVSAGGIVGKSFGYDEYSSSTLTISKCVNIGNVKGSESNVYVSGVVGRANFSTNISDSINLGATKWWDNGALPLNTSGFATIAFPEYSSQTCSIKNCISVGVSNSANNTFYAFTDYDGSNGDFSKLYYDSEKWEGKTLYDLDKVSAEAKTTTDLCSLTSDKLSDNWSFDTNRYPLPNVKETFSQFTGSDGKTVWQEIVEAATAEVSSGSRMVASWEDLESAITNIPEGVSTITEFSLTQDLDVKKKISVNVPIKIIAENNVTISRDVSFSDAFFEIGTAGSLEIESNNGSKITLDGKKESASSALINSSGNLTLTNCNLQNNKNTASFGGAIYINGGNATLTNCIVGSEVNDSGETESWRNAANQDNYSNYSAEGGGGIYIAEGIVAINNSKISFNYTPNPDQNYEETTPSDCTHGGGINIVKGSLSLTSSEVSYNSGYQGGGIRCYSSSSSAGTFTINDSNIKGNASRAYGCSDFGGAIMIKNFDFECGNITSTVEENYSGDGGAIFFEYSTTTLQNIKIQNNAYNEEGYCNGADVLLFAGSNVSISSETVQIINKETETKGVYINSSNNLNLSGSAHISTPIYLASDAKINVDGALTSASGTIVAKITLNDGCTSGTQILTTTNDIELAEIVGYFDLTNDNYILTEEGKIEVVTLISNS